MTGYRRVGFPKKCVSGWWLIPLYTPLKMMEFVSWDDEIPNMRKVIKFHGSKFQTTNQCLLAFKPL